MPEENTIRQGGRYVADRPGTEPKRVEPHLVKKAGKVGEPDVLQPNEKHSEYPGTPETKADVPAATAEKDKV